jgi:hypothetical protein
VPLSSGSGSPRRVESICVFVIVTRLLAGWPRNYGSIHGNDKIFLFSKVSRAALGQNQPSIQWVPGTLSRSKASVA